MAVGRELELSAVELVDLGLLVRQLQWSASGPLAAHLRSTLGSLRGSWDRMAGQLAGRSIVTGHWPDAQAEALAAGTDHTTVASGPIEDQAALALVIDCLDGLVGRVRRRTDAVQAHDPASSLLLGRIGGELEEQWAALRTQLPFGETGHDLRDAT